jgi:two-component system, chemotaxis family, sensor kinase CheA
VTGTLHAEEFLAGYLAEAHEHLATARKCVLAVEEALQRRQLAPRPTRELFRVLHTLKGLSGMIGAEPIVDISHEMESVLRAADRAGGRMGQDALDALLKGLTSIEERVERLARHEPLAPAPRALLDALANIQSAPGSPPQRSTDLPGDLAAKLGPADVEQLADGLARGRRAVRIDFVPSPERATRGCDITAVRDRIGRLGDIVKVLPRRAGPGEETPAGLVFVLVALTSAPAEELAAAVEAPVEAVREIRVTGPAGPGPVEERPVEEGVRSAQGSVRVEVARLDETLERVSALIVSRSRLARAVEELAATGVDVRVLRPILQDHARELRTLRAAVMRARLVRVSEVLERTPLLVRGLARSSGKQVRLDLDLGQVEVDKAVGERLFPSIVHLVRNAVDHAIESVEERRRLGKPDEATIRIACAHRGEGQLELVVSDDGRGIDLAAVAAKAGAPVPVSGPQILELIAKPGLSTLDAPTRTSGRGIGMDVVRRVVVTDLGGSLDVATRSGVGTTFTLRVPLSLTIVDGLTFRCRGETYVVPTLAVDELLEIDPAGLVAGPGPFRAGPPVRMLRWREESILFVDLGDVLGLRGDESGCKGIVVRREGSCFGFGVDRMIGRQEVVVRPVTDPLVERPGIAGATDLGDGKPTLVLDLVALTRSIAPAIAPAVPPAARERA